ncbi:hypothetical protein [Halopiger xanaduensis]|uniref:CT1 solute carrier family 6, member 8 n=1 Tax=Halopiger xanaduensis (strain DSM 18323 / JCM 14033 / SH-6) TaxID=797210 RepID=F8DC12_HALXS|nr:hypothetical protein [Halopiger xanaduensis]AEH35991.1 CT1; solute carrier family 6, member 8 [Halopiger xanaduensis SH-6]
MTARITATDVVSVLRLAALALLASGFIGWAVEGDAFDLASPYTVAFGAGLGCALVAIYLGIFLANGGE